MIEIKPDLWLSPFAVESMARVDQRSYPGDGYEKVWIVRTVSGRAHTISDEVAALLLSEETYSLEGTDA